MSRDVLQARGGDEAFSVGLVAGDEARVLPRLEVLRHRRRHHDERGEGVLERRLPLAWPRRRAPCAYLTKSRRGGEQEVGVRQRLAGTRPCRRRRGRARRPWPRTSARCRRREVSISAEEVARLLELLAGLRLERERHGVLGIGGVAAGVDDHVVVGERRHAGDDALHLLVGRVGLDVVVLEPLDRGRTSARWSRAASRSRSPPPRRARSTPPRRAASSAVGQASVCIEQVVLDRGEVDGGGGRGGRRASVSDVLSSPPQPHEGEAADDQESEVAAHGLSEIC